MIQKLKTWIQRLETHVNDSWYSFAIAALAWADNFILIIPNDGILISSVLLSPKKWIRFAIAVTIGSALGGAMLAYFVKMYGFDFINYFFEGLESSETWIKIASFFTQYGLLLLFFIAISPLMQQQVVILAALSEASLPAIIATLLLGRAIKYVFIAWISSHAPGKIAKLWGVRKELEEVGIDPAKIK